MFGNVTDFSHTRSHTEAIGFFVFTTILLVGLSTILVPVLGLIGIDLGTTTSTVVTGVTVHTLISTLFVLLLSSLILVGKKLTGDLLSIILTVVGVYATYHISVVLGMVVVSYLTTIKGK
ncbi:MAG: hypothetical protein H6865_08135 [Rhodospirillales bacterium]|nr:hypothetical protein [Alphaproteobacteria bacterium]MCB9987584.1 hypothetical protein [Rhodospirillales bacterium]USO07698.1 MAG: hypothetical protein H6866_00215 [Rhodospirillales bacterium]